MSEKRVSFSLECRCCSGVYFFAAGPRLFINAQGNALSAAAESTFPLLMNSVSPLKEA